VHRAVPGNWNLELGIWNLELGNWNLEFGTWNLELGTWNLELGTWNLEIGIWNLEFGTWNLKYSNLTPNPRYSRGELDFPLRILLTFSFIVPHLTVWAMLWKMDRRLCLDHGFSLEKAK
jgi:hypothetical protein